jgi:DNA-binding IclR family transcriptional regulator
MDSSLERMLDVLRLFTENGSVLTIDQVTEITGYSRSTVYRYFRTLASAGLLWAVAGGAYALGPFVLELDRHIRLNDPLLRAAPEVMSRLSEETGAVILLGRFYRNQVTCIHQEGHTDRYDLTVGRGLRLHLFRGATSKVILAHLPTRDLKDIYAKHAIEIAERGLGSDWDTFRQLMRAIRAKGYATSRRGEVDPDQFGVSAPVFQGNGRVLGGLTIVVRDPSQSPEASDHLAKRVMECAITISTEVARFLSSVTNAYEQDSPPDLD